MESKMTDNFFFRKHPFGRIVSTLDELDLLPKNWYFHVKHINKFTAEYAKDWYNINQVPKEGT